MKLGVCADIHGDTSAFVTFTQLVASQVDALVILGDLGEDKDSIQTIAKQCQIPAYVIAGNYESKTDFGVIDNYSAVHNMHTTKHTQLGDHHCVFIPGSDTLAPHASYVLVANTAEAQLAHFQYPSHRLDPIVLDDFDAIMQKNSVVFSHSPPKMRSKLGLDYAIYGIAKEDFVLSVNNEELVFEKGELILNQLGFATEMHSSGAPIQLHRKHVGPEFFAQFLRRHNVPFFFCGHIHEQSHVATTRGGKKLAENVWHKQLYYNVGALIEGKASIIELKEKKAKFRRILL